MWLAVLSALLALLAGIFAYVYRRQREMIVALRRAREKIQLEETRVFDFLHGLGAALTAASKPSDLHVLIVEGALRILDGESASSIPIVRGDYMKPVFDWRQLKRWQVSEAALPEGSEVRYRETTVWEQYRTPLLP